LLKDVPVTTKWADLPVAIKAELRKLAADRLAAFRTRWAGEALAKKETILLGCPTVAMTTAIDDYYRKTYDTVVPMTFSLKNIKSVAFARALVRHYLGTIAANRATMTYPTGKLPNRDWDGASPFDSVRLPDKRTFEDIKAYNAQVVRDLRSIDDAALDNLATMLRQRVLFDARAHAVGAFSGDSFGGGDMETACEIVGLDYDILGGYQLDKGRPTIFASDDEVLRETNALYLHNTELRWLDVGTLASALKLTLCSGWGPDRIQELVGDPATNDVAKGIILLQQWWIERVLASADAQKKCSVYSSQDRALIWEAFTADQHSNNDSSSSMDTYQTQLNIYRDDKTAQYRHTATLALRQVFPNDSVLTSAEHQRVVAAINAETAFGLLPSKIAVAIDAAQGKINGPAATVWKHAVQVNVGRIGGNYNPNDAVRPRDEVAVTTMFGEVKTWIANQYQGYPIEIVSLFPYISLIIDTSNNAVTDSTATIRFGVGTSRSKMEYYSLLLHELRHAVYYAWKVNAPDKSKVKEDEGPVAEGSGVAVEALLLELFVKQTLKNDTAYALYALDYGIRDARYVATTDATLQRYFRSSCGGAHEANTLDFARGIGMAYGLTGLLADNMALRAHAGTQYFQYISGGLPMLADIAYLQDHTDPSRQRRIDPFVLFACGLNTPRRDAAYIGALKVCMHL